MRELDPEIADKLEESLAATCLDKISPSQIPLQRVLSLVGNDLSALVDKELSSYIYTLAQYQVFLQAQCNSRHIKFLEAKRAFDLGVARELNTSDGKRTVKERTNGILLTNTLVQELEKDMRIKEADFLLFDKIPEAVAELTNALKKELSIRHSKEYTRY